METRQVLSFFFPPASVLASQVVIKFQGENDTATIYADFYMRSPRQLNSLGAKAAFMRRRRKARDGKVGASHCTVDRLWGSSRRCRDSLEGVNQS